jgi:hypothetical protein
MGGEIERIKETTNAYIILARKPKGKRCLERLTRKPNDNIKMDVSELVSLLTGFSWLTVGPRDIYHDICQLVRNESKSINS